MRVKTELGLAAAIFLIADFIFLVSPVRQVYDSKYSMVVSLSLLQHGTVALDSYAIPGFNKPPPGDRATHDKPYQLEAKNGHVYYSYPLGSSLLSVPYVAVMKAFGLSPINPDGSFNLRGERRIQTYLASFIMAALASLFFYTSRLLLPISWSVWVAVGAALGTQIWSTASRALWSDTWGIFLLGFVVWMLVARETNARPIRPVLLATLLAWTYFVRPTYCVPIVAVTVYLAFFYPSLLVKYILSGGVWLLLFLAYSWHHFGQLLPDYYQANQLSFDSFWEALAGSLVSPSRGLLIFVPVIGFIMYLLIRYAKYLTSRRLVALCFSVIVAHLIIIAGFPVWWGGHSYGPRYTTGLIPWFVLLAVLAIKARLVWRERQNPSDLPMSWHVESVAGGILLACSIAINANGALNQRALAWNVTPVNVDAHPERVWDWSDPQFLVK